MKSNEKNVDVCKIHLYQVSFFRVTLQETVKDIKLVEPSKCHTLLYLICIEQTVFVAHTQSEWSKTFVWRRTNIEEEEKEDRYTSFSFIHSAESFKIFFIPFLKIKSCQYWSFSSLSFHNILIVFIYIRILNGFYEYSL